LLATCAETMSAVKVMSFSFSMSRLVQPAHGTTRKSPGCFAKARVHDNRLPTARVAHVTQVRLFSEAAGTRLPLAELKPAEIRGFAEASIDGTAPMLRMRSQEPGRTTPPKRGGSGLLRSEVRVVSQALRQLYPVPSDGMFDSLLSQLDRASRTSRCW
jgi:hypothetical protein